MFAAILEGLSASRRTAAVAVLWLLALTILNVRSGGAYCATILFAIPVAIASWSDMRLGFLIAGASAVAARIGGAMPEPGATSPLWLDVLLAFVKLSIDAAVVNAWSRRRQRRHAQEGAPGDSHGGGDG